MVSLQRHVLVRTTHSKYCKIKQPSRSAVAVDRVVVVVVVVPTLAPTPALTSVVTAPVARRVLVELVLSTGSRRLATSASTTSRARCPY